MRPAELDVTFVLHHLDVQVTEDSGGDEPYLWILGFKVDADTLDMSTLPPTVGVEVFRGAPASPFVVGPNSVQAPNSVPIASSLGTRILRLKPALLVTGEWFAGLAGIVCLVWDQDGFSPSTSEAAFKEYAKDFGPTVSVEMNALLNGSYDGLLSQDATGSVVSPPDGTLQWRLDRLGVPASRKRAVKGIVKSVEERLLFKITNAILKVATWDELIDRDDLLGADAAVFMGGELDSPQDFTLRADDLGSDYSVLGRATASKVHVTALDGAVTSVHREFADSALMWMRVCWFAEKLYRVLAFRLTTTTRFQVRPIIGEPPQQVRWLLDDAVLAEGTGTVTVKYEPLDRYVPPPQNVLATDYVGGDGTLSYSASGPTLEVTNIGGSGIFFGTVTAICAYGGDPTLTPPAPPTLAELRGRGYAYTTPLSITAVELTMDSQYHNDTNRCRGLIDEVDRKRIPANLGRLVDPGDPPPDREVVLDRVTATTKFLIAARLQVDTSTGERPGPPPTRPVGKSAALSADQLGRSEQT
jgi:hypothetical protein